MSAAPRRVVYTALIGGYEQLREQPIAAASDVSFVCLTDDPDLTSDTWQVRLVEPRFPLDAVRSARELKILATAALDDVEQSLWIDARVTLEVDPGRILDDWLDGVDVAIPRHSFRKDVVSEFDAVLAAGMDEHARLYEQLTHYAAGARDELAGPVPWTGIIARRHSAEVADAMQRWFLEVVRYSRRDQLSVMRALHAGRAPWRLVELDNHASPFHTWHDPVGRSTREAVHRTSASLWSPVAELGELRREFETTVLRLNEAVAHRERLIVERDGHIATLQGQVVELSGHIDHHRAEEERLRGIIARLRKRLRAQRASPPPPPGWGARVRRRLRARRDDVQR